MRIKFLKKVKNRLRAASCHARLDAVFVVYPLPDSSSNSAWNPAWPEHTVLGLSQLGDAGFWKEGFSKILDSRNDAGANFYKPKKVDNNGGMSGGPKEERSTPTEFPDEAWPKNNRNKNVKRRFLELKLSPLSRELM